MNDSHQESQFVKLILMRKLLRQTLLLCQLLVCTVYSLERGEIAYILENSTVRISIWANKDKDGNFTQVESGGSGVIFKKVILDEDEYLYYVLTNAHVVLENYCFRAFKNQPNKECFDKEYDYSQKNIRIDGIKTEYEYAVNEILYWSNLDLAIVAFKSPENLQPIEIANKWTPLMEVYSAGFPAVMGNFKNYRNLFLTDGTLNTVITDPKGELQANNYTLIHDCVVSGGMSGGPLVDQEARLLGINGLGRLGTIESFEAGTVDLDGTGYHYSIHIYDFYVNVILDEKDNFNQNSIFYGYAPKLSKKYHKSFYDFAVKEFPSKIKEINLLFY